MRINQISWGSPPIANSIAPIPSGKKAKFVVVRIRSSPCPKIPISAVPLLKTLLPSMRNENITRAPSANNPPVFAPVTVAAIRASPRFSCNKENQPSAELGYGRKATQHIVSNRKNIIITTVVIPLILYKPLQWKSAISILPQFPMKGTFITPHNPA